ncbi:MAG: universal stress protein [Syntrophobacteraceae bacterium]|jgi:nucleotide-binding universal stress UspA family protein
MERKILFAVDGSEKCNQALRIAGDLLKNLDGCQVLLYHCVPELLALYPGEMIAPGSTEGYFERAGKTVLEASRSVLLETGFPADRIAMKLKMDSVAPSCDILDEAAASKIQTVVCGRRGRTPKKNLLIGSTSSRLSQYSTLRTVWVIDTPVHQTRKILIPMEGSPDSRALTYYAAEFFAPIPNLSYTLLHFMPKLPPRFWDHGRILSDDEEKNINRELNEWRNGTLREVEKFLSEARYALIGGNVPHEKVRTQIVHTKTDLARDMLDEIDRNQYQFVLIGKKSFKEQKPFLIGSNANKILKNVKHTILCLVDS